MSTDLKVGDRKSLNRQTFLHNGIFVFQGQSVEVKEFGADGVTVQYIDREGNPHLLTGVLPEELVEP